MSTIIRYIEENKVVFLTCGTWGHNSICSILRNKKFAGECLFYKLLGLRDQVFFYWNICFFACGGEIKSHTELYAIQSIPITLKHVFLKNILLF